MKYLKVDNVLTVYWCIQIFVLLSATGFGWLSTIMAGVLLVGIIISYKTRFKSLAPIFIQFFVTILYSFFLYVLVCMWGWKKIHIIVIITILINLIICGYEGRRIMGHRDSTNHY